MRDARALPLLCHLGPCLVTLVWSGLAAAQGGVAEPAAPGGAAPGPAALAPAAPAASGATSPARPPEERAKEHFTKGNALFLSGKFPEAGIEYRQTLELMPTLANPHKNLARCYLSMKQENMYPDAAFHLLRYRQLKPQDADAGVAADLQAVLRALGLPGRSGAALNEVGGLLEQQATAAAEEEKWSVAVLRFLQLRDLFPERSDLIKLLAESQLGALRCDEARSSYQAYLLVHPEEQDGLDLDSMVRECQELAREKGQESGVPGKLVVLANVTGAAVLVDGKRLGNTPLDAPLRLSGGDHQLALFKEGYETLSRKVSLAPGQSLQLELTLTQFVMPGSDAAPSGVDAGAVATARSSVADPRRSTLSLLPRAGLMTGFGGTGGTALGPSFALELGYAPVRWLTLDLEGGVHRYGRSFSSARPFSSATLESLVVPLLVGASHRRPLGPLHVVGGLGAGLLLSSTTLSGDDGQSLELSRNLLALRLHVAAEYPLGPGQLVLDLGYLAHPFGTVAVRYYEAPLVEDLGLGGLGLHLGYRYTL